jgi:hypothetical protein
MRRDPGACRAETAGQGPAARRSSRGRLRAGPHPYQRVGAERHANLRLRRSRGSVGGEVMRCDPPDPDGQRLNHFMLAMS